MQKNKGRWRTSVEELRHLQTLTVTAMLTAIAVVLSFYTVNVSETLKVGFSFLPKELTGFLFGPVVAGIMGGVTDIIQFFIKPTGPFFPGFTLDAILAGVIYGAILYKRQITIRRVLLANTLVTVIVNLLLATGWLSLLYGNSFFVLLPARALKQLVMLPIETMLFYAVCQALLRANIQKLAAHS